MSRTSIAMVTHVWSPDMQALLERLRRQAPADHDVRLLLSTAVPRADPELPSGHFESVTVGDLFQLPYPEKCHAGEWDIAGNLDLVFLEFRRRNPGYDAYWFVEYDVHYQGDWTDFFEHFRASRAGLIGTILERIAKTPHKLKTLNYPVLVVPAHLNWSEANMVKGFFPICRLSATLLDALDREYRAGLGGHYEVTMPTVAALGGMIVEDIGGNGPFVRDDNRDRFYFANKSSYSHSPGNFVFRPNIRRPLPYRNTLWHPVKPSGVPAWHPLRLRGHVFKNILEAIKPVVVRAWIRWWFAVRWRPLS